MLRAIFTGDISAPDCPVFEYNPETGHFHMLKDNQFKYPFSIVMNDKDWFLFAVDDKTGETVYLDTPRRLNEEEISERVLKNSSLENNGEEEED